MIAGRKVKQRVPMRARRNHVSRPFGRTGKTEATPFHALLRFIRVLIDGVKKAPCLKRVAEFLHTIGTLRDVTGAIAEIAHALLKVATGTMICSPHAACLKPLAF